MAPSAHACGGAPICTVKDPTGTPLNIRKSPKGKVIGTAKNGTELEFIDHQTVNGKRWARVGRFSAGEIASDDEGGWVFARYLKCQAATRDLPKEPWSADNTVDPIPCTVADPTSTPLNVRVGPGGEIYATVRNGVIVRASGSQTFKGKEWVFVNKLSSDNAIGWVYDPYLKCEEEGH